MHLAVSNNDLQNTEDLATRTPLKLEGEQRELHDIKDKSYTPFAFKIKIHINE